MSLAVTRRRRRLSPLTSAANFDTIDVLHIRISRISSSTKSGNKRAWKKNNRKQKEQQAQSEDRRPSRPIGSYSCSDFAIFTIDERALDTSTSRGVNKANTQPQTAPRWYHQNQARCDHYTLDQQKEHRTSLPPHPHDSRELASSAPAREAPRASAGQT